MYQYTGVITKMIRFKMFQHVTKVPCLAHLIRWLVLNFIYMFQNILGRWKVNLAFYEVPPQPNKTVVPKIIDRSSLKCDISLVQFLDVVCTLMLKVGTIHWALSK